MEKRILIDGVRYVYWLPKDENDVERILEEHVEELFGRGSILFSKEKLTSLARISSIPDGFVINFLQNEFYIVEVELSSHSFNHFIAQFSKFPSGFKNTRDRIRKNIYKQINKSPQTKLRVKEMIGKDKEISAFIDEVIPSSSPKLVIVIDEITSDLKTACKNQNIPFSQILELKTFGREGVEDLKVHVHYFNFLPSEGPRKGPPRPGEYTGKSISAFYFKNTKYEIHTWRNLLVKLAEIIHESHSSNFKKVLTLKGKKRPYFSFNENELRVPQKIDRTNIFMETNWSANSIVKICQRLLNTFDYSSEDLKIDAG
ncbi:hypothetical protein ES702_01562 [subsurface metagenome]